MGKSNLPQGMGYLVNLISFKAVVYKVSTLADNGIRLTLDLPETAIMQMAQMAECQRAGAVLNITAEASAEPDILDGMLPDD